MGEQGRLAAGGLGTGGGDFGQLAGDPLTVEAPLAGQREGLGGKAELVLRDGKATALHGQGQAEGGLRLQ